MGRRRAEEPEELDDDLGDAFEHEGDDEAPAPAPKARAKTAAKATARATPEETRTLDLRIFDAADRLEAKLGRAPTLPEIANAAKVPGASADSRRIRVSKAMRRRGLLTAAIPKAVEPGPGDKGYRALPRSFAERAQPPILVLSGPAPAYTTRAVALSPAVVEALVAERARLAAIVAHLDGTIAALGGAS